MNRAAILINSVLFLFHWTLCKAELTESSNPTLRFTVDLFPSNSPEGLDDALDMTQPLGIELLLNTDSIPLIGSGKFNPLGALHGSPNPRKEACSVIIRNRIYLVGGRGNKPVNYYDLLQRTWYETNSTAPNFHHCSCVPYKDRYIYVPSSWYGVFPYEQTHKEMFVYDTVTDTWDTAPGLGSRSRGAAAYGMYKGKLLLSFGNRGGHGSHATTLGEFDEYDFESRTWKSLPDAPDPRDHVGGGAVIRNLFCVGGGRDGGNRNFLGSPVLPVNCFNFKTYKWERRAHLPMPRGGVGNAATCQKLLMIAGGEGNEPGKWVGAQIFSRVDLYDPYKDEFLAPVWMSKGRHGMNLAVSDCSCGNIYYVSGAAGVGDGPLQKSTEVWSPDTVARHCT